MDQEKKPLSDFVIFSDSDLNRILNSAGFKAGLFKPVSPALAKTVNSAAWNYVRGLAYQRPRYGGKIDAHLGQIRRSCQALWKAIPGSESGKPLTAPNADAIERSDRSAALAALATRIGGGDPGAGITVLNQWRLKLEELSEHAAFTREEQSLQPLSKQIGIRIKRPTQAGPPSGTPKLFIGEVLTTMQSLFPRSPTFARGHYSANSSDGIHGPFITFIKGVLEHLARRLVQDPDLRVISEQKVLRPKSATIADWIDAYRNEKSD